MDQSQTFISVREALDMGIVPSEAEAFVGLRWTPPNQEQPLVDSARRVVVG